MAGIGGPGKPPFIQVCDRLPYQLRAMPTGAAADQVNAGDQEVGRRLHDQIEEDVSHHGGDAHPLGPLAPPP